MFGHVPRVNSQRGQRLPLVLALTLPLPALDRPEVFAVVLSGPVEDDGSCGHVDSHGERLGGEEDLHQTAAEADLHDLLLKFTQVITHKYAKAIME